MSQDDNELQSTTVKDVEQLGIFAAIASLSYVFWVCGGMELIERLAYYGVRQSSGLYITAPSAEGGLGLDYADLSYLFTIWAVVQTFVPVFTGGLSDRLGYKETIFMSTVFKILGYLIMAMNPSFWGFAIGAMVLAFGTGIFKPGLQGTIAKATNRQNSSMAWGVFYQTVNIGGFMGPILAVYLRQMSWDYVFYACAAIISINFLLLLVYKEPAKEERLAYRAQVKSGKIQESSLWRDSLKEISKPIILAYIVIFSGFWFMLMAFWDIAPLYFRDWVDTSTLITDVFGSGGTHSTFIIRLFGMNNDGMSIEPEGLVNLNSMLILFICFIVAGYSAKMRATTSMAVGTFLASAALLVFAGSSAAWIIVGGIIVFSIGEMLSSPKSSEYMANIAPADKKAMYLGFSQLPIGFGWIAESFFGPRLYGAYSSKDAMSRSLLSDGGMQTTELSGVANGQAFAKLQEISGVAADVLTNQMYTANNVGMVWFVMGTVGIVSCVGMLYYGRWTYRIATMPEAQLQAAE